MTPAELDAIIARAASVYPEDAGWDGDEAERALTTVTKHVPALAAALRGAWAERDAALAAVDAVRADYAPRREPPTAEEVRALERMQVAAGYTGGGAACFAVGMPDQFDGVTREMSADRVWAHASQFPSDEAPVVRVCGGPRVDRLGALWWLALGPTGPVAWSELAALVARGGDRG